MSTGPALTNYGNWKQSQRTLWLWVLIELSVIAATLPWLVSDKIGVGWALLVASIIGISGLFVGIYRRMNP